MIGIIDYKSGGNIHAYKNIFKYLNFPFIQADKPELLKECNKIILPGVGSFDVAIKSLKNSGFFDYLKFEFPTLEDKKLMGVCVGLQVLCESSDEGDESGIEIFKTHVRKFDSSKCKIVPHMGWNSVEYSNDPIFNGIKFDEGFYFLHSYRLDEDFKDAIAFSSYNSKFACSARKKNFIGFQFHPEKSHDNGMKLIKNFIEE